MIVVSNSSPLAALTAINQTELLQKLYGRILIPDAVWREVIEQGAGRAGVADLIKADWIERHTVVNKELITLLQDSLDAGESEAIALTLQMRADLLLMDERLGRLIAHRLGLRIIGVVGVVIASKHQGLIPLIKPLLDQLRDEVGFRLSEALYRQVLADERESS